ncbi:PEGA domain-containing protein [Candidatus Saccharibacteria bacterium]|nr:PEGA domain-containing protein [Candidatus Saccharibacteria bacterium]
MDGYDKKKIIMIMAGIVSAIVVIIVIALVNIIPKIGKVEVYVGYAPFVADVKMDGETVKNNSKIYLEEGDYSVEVSYEGFEPYSGVVTVTKDTSAIYGNIVAQTEEAEKIASEHIDDYLIIEGYFAQELSAEGEDIVKKFPIVSILPITNSLYKVGYEVSSDNSIVLTIDTINTYVDVAVEKLKNAASNVDDLAKYDIKISGFDNVLAGSFVENNAASSEDYIKNGFGNVLGFEFMNGTADGDYYIAKVKTGDIQMASVATYLMIIKKEDGKWKFVSTPSQIMTLYNTIDVPIEVLDVANNL